MTQYNIEQFLTPHNLSPSEHERFWQEYWLLTPADDAWQAIFESLYSYFFSKKKLSRDEISTYYTTYWSWLVDSFFRSLYRLDEKVILELVGPTFITAHQLGLDVKQELFYYMRNRGIEDEPIKSRYELLRREIELCDFPISLLVENEARTIKAVAFLYKQSLRGGQPAVQVLVSKLRPTIFSFETEPFNVTPNEQVLYIRRLLSNALYIIEQKDPIADMVEYFDQVEDDGLLREISVEAFFSQKTLEDTQQELIAEHQARRSAGVGELPINFSEILDQHKSDLKNHLMQTPTLQAALAWLSQYDDRAEAWRRLIELMKTHAMRAVHDPDTAARMIEFSDFLQANGYEGQPDLVYYDEATGKFMWHS